MKKNILAIALIMSSLGFLDLLCEQEFNAEQILQEVMELSQNNKKYAVEFLKKLEEEKANTPLSAYKNRTFDIKGELLRAVKNSTPETQNWCCDCSNQVIPLIHFVGDITEKIAAESNLNDEKFAERLVRDILNDERLRSGLFPCVLPFMEAMQLHAQEKIAKGESISEEERQKAIEFSKYMVELSSEWYEKFNKEIQALREEQQK